MASHFHTGGGIGYIQTVPDPQLIAKGISGVRPFLEQTVSILNDQFDAYIKDSEALGVADGAIAGSPSKSILSPCVFIGKGSAKNDG